MPGTADIDEIDLREACDELVGPLLGDEVAHLAAHQKHRHVVRKDRLDRGVHAVDLGHFDGGKRGCAVDELRIPMPVPAAVAFAQVCPETIEVGGPGPMGVVLLDHVGDLIQ